MNLKAFAQSKPVGKELNRILLGPAAAPWTFVKVALAYFAPSAPNSNLANLVIYGVLLKNQHFVT